MPFLNHYVSALTRLKRGNSPGLGKAPHKPVLLITLLELIGQGKVVDNRFYPDAELVGVFQENWRLLVNTAHDCDFTQPFYHLQNDLLDGVPLWLVVPLPGCQYAAPIKSVNTLIKVVAYGQLEAGFFVVMQDAVLRRQVTDLLVQHYFPATAAIYYRSKQAGEGYYHDLEAWVLNAPEVRKKLISIDTEEEVYVRSGLFKRLVPQVYKQTCCISGMQLGSTFGHNYVDACHIVPFSVSHDDRVTNGLALCPNLHRVFDRGLVTITEEYKVMLSAHILEDRAHYYSLAKLEGRRILLPEHKYAWPDPEMLAWHREHRFAK